MTLAKFFTDTQHEKTIRILVYPNITFSKDLTKDSYIQVITNMIAELNKIRTDLYFYLIVPEFLEMLNFHNTHQYIMEVPTYPPTMRSHFNVDVFKNIVNHDLDIDIVFSHLPEHTHAVKNVIGNVTHHTPSYFGYCHWFDLDEVVAWSIPSFNQNITGLLEMQRCYLNTQYQKDLVIRQAKNIFNQNAISKLENILQVQHLGVKEKDIVNAPQSTSKTIVFNHRPDSYKDFGTFMKIINQLRTQRNDFQVWIPLLDNPTESWIDTSKLNKEKYYNKLQTCRVGFSPKQVYGGWSVSTTDGIMNGCPYIMYDADYYHELNSTADFFSSVDEAVHLLNKYLDDESYRNSKSFQSQQYLKNNLIYANEIRNMSEYIDTLVEDQKMTKTEVTDKLISVIKTKKQITKRELFKEYLGWGRGIKFGPYRRALLDHPNIYDIIDETPCYCWID
jgi:glycosyltransferase involved in cell wall biosynthesis